MFDLSHVAVKSYFANNGSQNYLILQPVFKYFTTNGYSILEL